MGKVASIIVTALVVAGMATSASASPASTIIVRPGQSIQAAVDGASPGDRILVFPGTYTEPGRPCPTNPLDTCAVVVAKDGITLQGLPTGGHPVILENAGGQAQGIAFAKTGDPSCLSDSTERIAGAVLSGFTVQGFDDTGVLLFCADHWRVTSVVATGDLEYGIFPSHSGPGRVDHSSATGANDTGIYVGQSHDVTVDHNLATGNVSGFEIENSSNVRLSHNEASGNTAGILSFTLPFLDVTANDDNRIDHNFVHDNNKPNTCAPGDIVCNVPAGSGIAVVAADANTVDHNVVSGNDSFGILVANICNALQIPPAVCAVLDIEPNTDDARIVFDHVLGNGGTPAPGFPLPGGDLLWDGTGTGNCWSHDVYATSFPSPLPMCG